MVSAESVHRGVAAQFQCSRPGDVWAAYASTGRILRGLLSEIRYEQSRVGGLLSHQLNDLHRHVANTQVTVWSVRHNAPGCLPDEPAENYSRWEWPDAVAAFRGNIESSFCDHDCECHLVPLERDTCHGCADRASIQAILADAATPTGSEAEDRRCPTSVGRKSPCGEVEEIHVLDLVTGRAGDLFGDH